MVPLFVLSTPMVLVAPSPSASANGEVRASTSKQLEAKRLVKRLYGNNPSLIDQATQQIIALGGVGREAVQDEMMSVGYWGGGDESEERKAAARRYCTSSSLNAFAAMFTVLRRTVTPLELGMGHFVWDIIIGPNVSHVPDLCKHLPKQERNLEAERRLSEIAEKTLQELNDWPPSLSETQLQSLGKSSCFKASTDKLRWYFARRCFSAMGDFNDECTSGSYLFDSSGKLVSFKKIEADDDDSLVFAVGLGWHDKDKWIGYVQQDSKCCDDNSQTRVYYALKNGQSRLCQLVVERRLKEMGVSKLERLVDISPTGCKVKKNLPRWTYVNLYQKPGPVRVARVASDDVLNVRREPDPSSKVLGKLSSKSRCVASTGIVRRFGKSEWWQLKLSSKQTGWVNAAYLKRHLGTDCP